MALSLRLVRRLIRTHFLDNHLAVLIKFVNVPAIRFSSSNSINLSYKYINTYTNIHARIFIVALFVIAKKKKSASNGNLHQ